MTSTRAPSPPADSFRASASGGWADTLLPSPRYCSISSGTAAFTRRAGAAFVGAFFAAARLAATTLAVRLVAAVLAVLVFVVAIVVAPVSLLDPAAVAT